MPGMGFYSGGEIDTYVIHSLQSMQYSALAVIYRNVHYQLHARPGQHSRPSTSRRFCFSPRFLPLQTMSPSMFRTVFRPVLRSASCAARPASVRASLKVPAIGSAFTSSRAFSQSSICKSGYLSDGFRIPHGVVH